MSSRSRSGARNPQPSKKRPTPAPNRPAKRAAPAKGAAPKPNPRPKTPSVAAPAPAPDLPKYEFNGRLKVILGGQSQQEEKVVIEGPWREEGSEQTCAFSRMSREDDDLASSVVAPPDGVWGGYMKIGDLASYSSKRESQSYDRFMLRFRESGPGTYTLDGEGKAGTNTYKLTGEAKASDGGFNLTLTRIYGRAPVLPPPPKTAPKTAPRGRASKRASTRSSGEDLAAFNENGGAMARRGGQEASAFWAKPSGVDGLNMAAWVKREADAYRDENELGKSKRPTSCAEHVYALRRDLFEGQFANPVKAIMTRLNAYLDARPERKATDAPVAATDEAPAPAPAPAP